MRLMTPISACFDAPQSVRRNLDVLHQSAQIGDERLRVGHRNLPLLQESLQRERRGDSLRFGGVTLQTFLQHIQNEPHAHRYGRDITILHADAKFDSTPYNYLIQAALHGQQEIYSYAFRCYGHPLAYLLEKVTAFHQERQPSFMQLGLFSSQLNEALFTFLVSQPTPDFEPETPAWRLGAQRLLRQQALYRAEPWGWRRSTLLDLRNVLSEQMPHGTLVWVDGHGGKRGGRHAQHLVRRLRQWQLPSRWLRSHRLHHASRDLPAAFALLTLTPNDERVARIADWAMRWV